MFELDTRLRADTLPVGDLPLCRVLLMNDCRYPWLILVPRVADASEILDLCARDRDRLWQEVQLASRVLHTHCPGDKLNLGALGNLVPQLHFHVLMRQRQDPAWPGPVWGHSAARPYPQAQAQQVIATLQAALFSAST
jgi:diadenosine tetraphosphate (Ap4A) HIT family hydrolase